MLRQAGFFYAIYRAGKSALEQDANRSSSLSSSWQKVHQLEVNRLVASAGTGTEPGGCISWD